jgi:hypothetical protein
LGAGENVISDWVSNTEKDSFEKLKRLVFNCTPIIEKMIWKIEIAPNISDLNPGQFTIKNN